MIIMTTLYNLQRPNYSPKEQAFGATAARKNFFSTDRNLEQNLTLGGRPSAETVFILFYIFSNASGMARGMTVSICQLIHHFKISTTIR